MNYYGKRRGQVLPCIIFMADGRCPHGGIVDRFKGIVTMYALSKVNTLPFYINYTSPFNILELCFFNVTIGSSICIAVITVGAIPELSIVNIFVIP